MSKYFHTAYKLHDTACKKNEHLSIHRLCKGQNSGCRMTVNATSNAINKQEVDQPYFNEQLVSHS